MFAIAATTTKTAAAASALFTGFGDIHGQRSAINAFAIERLDCGFCLFRAAHGDKAKATRTPSFAVHHQVGLEDSAVGGKHVLKIVFGCVEGKISNEQFVNITHVIDVL